MWLPGWISRPTSQLAGGRRRVSGIVAAIVLFGWIGQTVVAQQIQEREIQSQPLPVAVFDVGATPVEILPDGSGVADGDAQ